MYCKATWKIIIFFSNMGMSSKQDINVFPTSYNTWVHMHKRLEMLC